MKVPTERSHKALVEPVTEERVAVFVIESIKEQFGSLPLEDFQQEYECVFVDQTYSFYPYDLILPCSTDDIKLYDDFTDMPFPEGRLVAGFDVGRTRDDSELALFEQKSERWICRMLKSYHQTPFAEQEIDLRRLLHTLPISRLSIDNSGIGMPLAENLARDHPQVVQEVFSNANKERWATDFKILLQRRDVMLPRDRDMVGQIHSIKKKVLPSGNVNFDSERPGRGGHADRFWAIVMACQRERQKQGPRETFIGVRIIG